MAQHVHFPGTYVNITSTTGSVVAAKRGFLHSVTFNKPVATGVVTLYDNATGTSTATIATITTSSTTPVTLTYDVYFGNGLFVQESTVAQDITVSFL